jgi:cytochrome c oxidase assembly protein subunit 15
MDSSKHNPWLHRFACLTALATLALVVVGGLVTSVGAGMSVPDWPNSYGYNMFRFPISKWVGGILYEHSHRLIASFVGLLVVMLTRWLGGSASRFPLSIIGLLEVGAGELILHLWPEWKGAGYFLSGIGVLVLLAGIVWVRSEPARGALPMLGWYAFVAVQVQGLLGGLRVVLLKDELGIFHATLAQLFFVLLCVIGVMTSRWWRTVEGLIRNDQRISNGENQPLSQVRTTSTSSPFCGEESLGTTWKSSLPLLFVMTTVLILAQLILGATMRHQHAGLAIPDFPLAYGKVWPAMDARSVEGYNQHREEVVSLKPITGFQVGLQMVHRLMALGILGAVVFCVMSARRVPGEIGGTLTRVSRIWLGLVIVQAFLGAATIWSNKAADIATAHVLTGALLLVTGTFLSMLAFQCRRVPEASRLKIDESFAGHSISSQKTAVTM